MKHEEKIKWMKDWAEKNNCTLELEGECGFGRPCVGILCTVNECYPDYQWYDEEWNDLAPEVWIPEDAYHKHPCVAVLGRGVLAEEQLYDWLKWFDYNGYFVQVKHLPEVTDPIKILLGQHIQVRLTKGIGTFNYSDFSEE